MAFTSLLARATTGTRTTAGVTVAGQRGLAIRLDANAAQWGTRDPATPGTPDVIVTIEGSTDGVVWTVLYEFIFCVGARGAKDGLLPTMVIGWGEDWVDTDTGQPSRRKVVFPAGMQLRGRIVRSAGPSIGLLAEVRA